MAEGSPGLQSAIFIQVLQNTQHMVYVLAHTELVVESIPNKSVLIYEISHPGDSQTEPPGDVIEAGDLPVAVSEKGEGEGEAGAESPVAGSFVGADADQVCSVSLDGFVGITEALRLAVSARGEVLRVEVEDHWPISTPLGEVELLAIVAEGFEIGGQGPGLKQSTFHT